MNVKDLNKSNILFELGDLDRVIPKRNSRNACSLLLGSLSLILSLILFLAYSLIYCYFSFTLSFDLWVH